MKNQKQPIESQVLDESQVLGDKSSEAGETATQSTSVPSSQLPAAMQADYVIVGEWPNKFEVTGLEVAYIEWSKMTPAFADVLIENGFPGIKKK